MQSQENIKYRNFLKLTEDGEKKQKPSLHQQQKGYQTYRKHVRSYLVYYSFLWISSFIFAYIPVHKATCFPKFSGLYFFGHQKLAHQKKTVLIMERSSTRGSRGRHRIQGTVLISREVEGVDSWKVFTGPEALGHKQKHGRLPLNIRKSFFIVRVPEHWYRFSRAGCGASVLGDKSCLDSHLQVTLLEQGCGADVPQRSQPSLTLL